MDPRGARKTIQAQTNTNFYTASKPKINTTPTHHTKQKQQIYKKRKTNNMPSNKHLDPQTVLHSGGSFSFFWVVCWSTKQHIRSCLNKKQLVSLANNAKQNTKHKHEQRRNGYTNTPNTQQEQAPRNKQIMRSGSQFTQNQHHWNSKKDTTKS